MQAHHARTINAIIKKHKDYRHIGRVKFEEYGKVQVYERIPQGEEEKEEKDYTLEEWAKMTYKNKADD
jgi:hypothetical protein